MMPTGATVVVVILVVAAVVLLVLGVRGLRAANTFRRLKTSAISNLGAGHVEISGTVRAIDAPLQSAWEEPCVFVHSSREEKTSDGYAKPKVVGSKHVLAEVSDSSGSCSIDLRHAEVHGVVKAIKIHGARLNQLVIADGAQVLVALRVASGHGRAFGVYRSADAPRRLEGTPEEPMLIYVGSHSSALVRLSWHSAITIACGLALGALAIATTYLSISVQVLRNL